MIHRNLSDTLLAAAARMPAVVVTGPRQSGKTTLCRALFPGHAYVSLETPDRREFATSDPRGFLDAYRDGAILDEVQRTPELLSYLQEELDADPAPGRFILTGSQHFGLTEAVSQSLAGRVSVHRLLPMGLDEVRRFPEHPEGLWETVWTGGYPRILDCGLDPGQWLADYTETYLQRDVRQVLNVSDLGVFSTFVRLCAGRTAQEQNLSALGSDAGVSYNTIRAWLTVLEASFVIHRLPAWHRNFRKRAVKAPRVHFVDTGLACNLLGIRSAEELRYHPLRGALFESWVAGEILKARVHRGRPADLFHMREARGAKVDVLVEDGLRVRAVEAKSGSTLAGSHFGTLRTLLERAESAAPPLRFGARLVYGGEHPERRHGVEVVPWDRIQEVEW